MAVQIVSDLHLEAPKAYDIFEIVPRAPVLALLGDIGNAEPHQAELAGFLERQLRQFRAVLYVPGNHEAYGSTWPRALAVLRSLEADVRARREGGEDVGLGELVVLDRGVYRLPAAGLPTVVVLGCRLFSHVPPSAAMAVEMGVNDFYQTGDGWDVAAHNGAHARDLAWLNATVAAIAPDEAVLVLTHWCPSRDARAQDPRHARSAIASAFATDLSGEPCFRAAVVRAWAFGHTHYNCDFVVARGGESAPLRLLANQRGYYAAQAAGYDGDKIWQAEVLS